MCLRLANDRQIPALPSLGLKLWLAVGAEVAAAIADGEALNQSPTDGAELTTKAVSNLKLKMGCPQFTTGAKVCIHTGSFIVDG